MPDKVALELASQISNQNLSKEGWTTYYVDGTNGNDGANGLTWNSAFATIQHAVDTAESWGKIYIKAGTYSEEVNITTTGITLIGENKITTIISNESSVPLTIIANRCYIEELTVNSGAGTNTLAVNGSYTVISKCNIIGEQLAIGGNYNEIMYCTASSHGFYVAGLYNILHDCSSDGSGSYGILLRGNSRYNQIFNNNIWNAVNTGIHLDLVAIGPSYTTIYHNNLISNNIQVADEGTNNSWFENHYDDHITDTNNDGITDTPYTFTTGTDHTPVSKRNGWKQVSLGNVAGSSIAEIESKVDTVDTVVDAILANQAGQETIASYDLPNDTAENILLTITNTKRLRLDAVWLDLVNLVKDITIKVYHKIDGTNYRQYDVYSWGTAEEDGVLLRPVTINSDWKITVTSTVAQGAIKAIPYDVIKTTMEA